MASTVDCPILIVGAGIAGLTLAQVLRSNAVPFRLIERKESAEAGGAGWGFTINWSLASLLDMLGPELGGRFDETFVDREAVARGEDATFPFFDVLTGEMKYEVPRNQKRVRVNRDKLRKLLLTDVAVEWSKSLESIDVSNDSDVVTVHLDDGSKITSHLVVGCDGTHSRVRRSLFPDGWTNKPIPANMFGMTVRFTEKELVEIRKLDSFFLHGTDRENGTYFWFSLLDVPSNDESGQVADCTCQILLSWPATVELPETNAERHAFVQSVSKAWASPFGEVMRAIPKFVEIKRVTLDDWIYQYSGGIEMGKCTGRVILMGDSGHSMTMYRGEGANHAITDVHEFAQIVVPKLKVFAEKAEATKASVDIVVAAAREYEDAMFKRTWIAVLASRQATVDAHQWQRITDESPLVAKRAKFLHEIFDVEAGLLI